MKYSVVVAEDEELLLNNIIEKINSSDTGFEVAGSAQTGEQAYALVEKLNPDLVVSDIRMPVMDGYQATREIREFDVDTPIVALSANVFADEIQNAFESGMDEFLEKPVVMSKMFSVLGQLLSTASDAPLHGPD